jgi:hypothetical protein
MAEGEEDNIAGANFQDSENVTKYLKYEGTIEPNKSAVFQIRLRMTTGL